MPILSGLAVNRLREIQLLDNDAGPKVKVLVNDVHQLVAGLVAGAIGLNEDAEGLGDTDGIGKLHERAAGEAAVNDGFGDPAGKIGSRAVYLAVVFAGESTSAVGTPATVGVDNDLAAGETGITLRTADDE